MTRSRLVPPALVAALLAAAWPGGGLAYVEALYSLGSMIAQSSNVLSLQIEKVDRERNLIVFRKLRDLKGTHPGDVVKHNIGRGGFHPREWQAVMAWAEPGRTAVMFHNGSATEVCIGTYWYQCTAGGEWWNHTHGEPYMLRTFCGRAEKLAAAIADLVAGRDAVIPVMSPESSKDDLHLRRGRVIRMKASLKLQDYNPKRDFVGLGGDDLRRLTGMPGFTHLAALGRADPDASAISFTDIEGDGKLDFALIGGGKFQLYQNGGEAFSEVPLAGTDGCRAGVWADYNGDGKPDLFLATATGPRLFTNLGAGQFRDDTQLLPREPFNNLTTAAWLDYDNDGKPDLLVANGFHGLRLYRNRTPDNVNELSAPPALGPWWVIGPFDNDENRGFDRVYAPEREIDLAKSYDGKSSAKAAWRKHDFVDGTVCDLKPTFPLHTENVAVYLHREITAPAAQELPCSFGSDDTITVWLNGEKLFAENVQRGCAADQNRATLKLKPGKNALLIKICQGTGDWAYYFRAGAPKLVPVGWFEDVSARVGLGPDGLGGTLKGDGLVVADFDGDGRPDFYYAAGPGLLARATKDGFAAMDSGVVLPSGPVAPVACDFDGDGSTDLFLPHPDGCKLYRNLGGAKFADVTPAVIAAVRGATGAAWGDLDNDGRPDLILGVLGGPNRAFRNLGGGQFADITEVLGLHTRVFNSRSVALADVNGDGALDLLLANEGHDSVLLLGAPVAGPCSPVTLRLPGKLERPGLRVDVFANDGRRVAGADLCGGSGRGGQGSSVPRFTLSPGTYRIQYGGKSQPVVVGPQPQKVRLE